MISNTGAINYTVSHVSNPNVPYTGDLWIKIKLEPECFKYVEDAIEVASIFNSITKSAKYLAITTMDTYPNKEEL